MLDSQLSSDRSDGLSQMIAIGFDSLWNGTAPMEGPIHGVKMDVQGMELEALRGMSRTLARYRPKVVLEIHKGVSRDAVLAVIGECGYEMSPIPIEENSVDFSDPDCNFSFLFVGKN